MKKHGYLWITLVLFLGSLAGHWTCAWFAYVEEQYAHQQPVEVGAYLVEVTRDTLENWQSEFLQHRWDSAELPCTVLKKRGMDHDFDLSAAGR
jgi:hypothetical protein